MSKYVRMREIGIKRFVHPGWLVGDLVKKHLARCAKQYAKGKLLDIGCGIKPYETVFRPYVNEHIGVDHEGMLHDKENVDIFADAYSIPVDDNSFDTVLCSEVLEHLEEPKLALQEMHRVLGGGGYAIFTLPFAIHLHEEPRDFYRYTKHGLSYLAQESGFDVVEIRSRGGLLLVIFTEIAYCVDAVLPLRVFAPLKWIVFFVWLHIAKVLNFIDPIKELFPLGYTVVLRKIKSA